MHFNFYHNFQDARGTQISQSSRISSVTLIFLVFLILILAGCAQQNTAQSKPNAADAQAKGSYTVTAPATGKLIGLISAKGERVSKGQPLFAISDAQLDAQVKDLQTRLAKAEAELKRLQQGSINAAPAGDLSAAQAKVTAAQQKAAKLNALYAQGAISRQQAQNAQNELVQATRELQSATQLVVSSRPASPADIEAQQKGVDLLKLDLAKALAKQQDGEALSPCTGLITEVKASNNVQVEAGQVILVMQEEAN